MTAIFIPTELRNHPDGDDVRDWGIYREYSHSLQILKHRRTFREFTAVYLDLIDLYGQYHRSDKASPSSIGLGRSVLAYKAALTDLLPETPQWASTMGYRLTQVFHPND